MANSQNLCHDYQATTRQSQLRESVRGRYNLFLDVEVTRLTDHSMRSNLGDAIDRTSIQPWLISQPSTEQGLDYRTGDGKKALSFPAEDQPQGSDEGHFKDLSAAPSRLVIHDGD
jgi:hypothetical protein